MEETKKTQPTLKDLFTNKVPGVLVRRSALEVFLLILVLVIIFLLLSFYRENTQLKANLASLQRQLEETSANLANKEQENLEINQALTNEKNRLNQIGAQFNEITSTVNKLDKLSKTDKELLQKYSKVYFLNENYIPEDLRPIEQRYIYDKNKQIDIHTKVYPFLTSMINRALEEENINILIISGYRSFQNQVNLKSNYVVKYGQGANAFSADQGFSEHQIGTTLDLTTAELANNYTEFESSKAYNWLERNAYKYGFILSYPKGNTYYVFEPWHWRFVGKELATYLHSEGKNFYDLDQREIDKYLVNIFD